MSKYFGFNNFNLGPCESASQLPEISLLGVPGLNLNLDSSRLDLGQGGPMLATKGEGCSAVMTSTGASWLV